MSITKENQEVAELSDDIEVVGPGAMLAQARQTIGLSQQEVADKLNFRLVLVKNIENEVFDKAIPVTFIRGYLRSYAKLVNLSGEDVLASYQMLNIAQQQGAEMQSFSKGTEKQAESNRIMWISYLILALLIAATIAWWLQQGKMSSGISSNTPNISNTSNTQYSTNDTPTNDNIEPSTTTLDVEQSSNKVATKVNANTSNSELSQQIDDSTVGDRLTPLAIEQSSPTGEQVSGEIVDNNGSDITPLANRISQVEFTFSGDCWVNIFDDSGERLAWGIKKSGYVMSITGKAPFNVTLGKPELVAIKFNDNVINMSQFNRGNIAKFSLPLK
jgi:cytoskeleton protein RodZ